GMGATKADATPFSGLQSTVAGTLWRDRRPQTGRPGIASGLTDVPEGWTMRNRRSLVIGVFAALLVVSGVAVDGQGRGGGAFGAGPFTPEPGARDLKTVLFNWTWHMGMLRSGNESELVKTLYYEADGGTIQVNGQPCTVTRVRIYANYQIPGYRTPIECTLPNGQTYSNVEVLSASYAWDEDIPGAELVPGEGTVTPRPNTWAERWIR